MGKKLSPMELPSMDVGWKAKLEDTESKYYQMGLYSKVNGRRVASYLANVNFLTVKFMMDNGMKVNQKDLVSRFGQMGAAMKVTGIKANL